MIIILVTVNLLYVYLFRVDMELGDLVIRLGKTIITTVNNSKISFLLSLVVDKRLNNNIRRTQILK